MVKIFTQVSLCCLLACGTAFAAPAGLGNIRPSVKAEKMVAHQQREVKAKEHKATVTRADVPADPITNPVGVTKYYYKNATALDSYYGDWDIVDEPSVFVFGDNDEVYIQDFYTLWYAGTYVKGTIKDNTITINFPQTVIYWADYGYGIEVCLLEVNASGDYEVSDIDSVTLSIDESTGVITLDLPGEPYQYGVGVVYTDDQSVDGIEFSMEYSPVTDLDINTVPEDVELSELMFINDNYGYPVYVGKDNENLYLKGLSQNISDGGVIIASIDGNTASIEPGQIVGASYGMWLYAASIYYNEELNDFDILSDPYVLNVDWDNMTITTADDQDYFLGLTADMEDSGYLYELFYDINIFQQESFEGTPMNPYGLYIDDEYYEDYGFVYFIFSLPNISTEDTVLDPENLYYRIFVDDEVMEFEPTEDEYFGLEEPTELLPYNFFNSFDINMTYSNERAVGIYSEGYTTLGVQSVYIYDGETTESKVVTLNVETGEESTGIESITNADVVDSAYFNLQGLKVANPENGIFIKRSTLSNGKTIVKKIVKK